MAEPAETWTRIVLAEAAVSYAYAVAGPRLPDAERDLAALRYDQHKQARDEAMSALLAAGGEVPTLPTFFELPSPVATDSQARALLASVEARLATNYADLIAVVARADREPPLRAMQDATTRAAEWGAVAGPWGAVAADPSEG